MWGVTLLFSPVGYRIVASDNILISLHCCPRSCTWGIPLNLSCQSLWICYGVCFTFKIYLSPWTLFSGLPVLWGFSHSYVNQTSLPGKGRLFHICAGRTYDLYLRVPYLQFIIQKLYSMVSVNLLFPFHV